MSQRTLSILLSTLMMWAASVSGAFGQASKTSASGDQNEMVITFKDGHQQTVLLSDVKSIEFKTTAAGSRSSASYVGRWKVGTGLGSSTFVITLDRNGKATKTQGSPNGTWSMFGDEARIAWDDGWHDVIRKAGNHYEKAAYAPGKSYSDAPDNIAGATSIEPL